MRNDPSKLDAYLARLREVSFVEDVRLAEMEPRVRRGPRPDARIVVRTPSGERSFLLAIKKSHLSRALAAMAVEELRVASRRWILMAPSIGGPLGRYLAEHAINFIDLQGNCHLRMGRGYVARIEGRREIKDPRGRGVRAAGYQALFALLAKRELCSAPLRTVAAAAGVSRQAVSSALTRLVSDGMLVGSSAEYQWVEGGRRLALERWILGYATVVRPKLFMGSFRTADEDAAGFENRMRSIVGDRIPWRWGGSAAGYRLTGHYRGPNTVIHAAVFPDDLRQDLGAVRDSGGPLTVLGIPGDAALEGRTPDTAHPLLVYSEMICSGRERAREAAAELVTYLDLE
jgi:hypothetical protein